MSEQARRESGQEGILGDALGVRVFDPLVFEEDLREPQHNFGGVCQGWFRLRHGIPAAGTSRRDRPHVVVIIDRKFRAQSHVQEVYRKTAALVRFILTFNFPPG